MVHIYQITPNPENEYNNNVYFHQWIRHELFCKYNDQIDRNPWNKVLNKYDYVYVKIFIFRVLLNVTV